MTDESRQEQASDVPLAAGDTPAPIPPPPASLLTDALAAHARGWLLTPLVGGAGENRKRPILTEWTTRPAPTEQDIRDWLALGYGLGVRTGRESGIVIVDVDPRHGGDAASLPPTVVASTPGGGTHHYYRAPEPCPRNSAGRLVPIPGAVPQWIDRDSPTKTGIDVRGVGGQAVLPSAHSDPPGYAWLFPPGVTALAEYPFPPEPIRVTLTPSPAAVAYAPDAYGHAALAAELQAVASAPEGTRNDTLNRSAFRLGQLVGSGLLDRESTVEQLVVAACQSGLQERESRACAWRAVEAGSESPRGPAATGLEGLTIVMPSTLDPEDGPDAPMSEPVLDATPVPIAPLPSSRLPTKTVLVPGAHRTPTGEYEEVSNSDFASRVLAALPTGTLYRRDRVPGVVSGNRFHPVDEDDLRRICDPPNVRLARWTTTKRTKKGETEPTLKQSLTFENCASGYARLVKSHAAAHADEIRFLTCYPVLTPQGTISEPGYSQGIYYHGESVEPWTDLDRIRTHLLDLVVDFPFEDDASRANFLGLLLTPMLRPAIAGNVPMHLVTSPIARSGKTRLVEQVLGITYLGEELDSAQLPERPEERAKWLTSLLLSGASLVHLDNLTPELDSGNLASVLTSRRVTDRLLGSSTMLSLRNDLVIAATGNNTQLSGELSKRSVVVRLVPNTPHPENRTGFQHPDLSGFVTESRASTLAALAGLAVLAQRRAQATMGGFEAWAALVGGCLDLIGLPHLANLHSWRERTDVESAAVQALVITWWERFQGIRVQGAELLAAMPAEMEAIGVRPGSSTSAGMHIGRLVDRQFQFGKLLLTVRLVWSKTRSRAYCLEQGPEDLTTQALAFGSVSDPLSGPQGPDSGHAKEQGPERVSLDW